jgi:hypothetical protein
MKHATLPLHDNHCSGYQRSGLARAEFVIQNLMECPEGNSLWGINNWRGGRGSNDRDETFPTCRDVLTGSIDHVPDEISALQGLQRMLPT